MDVVEHKPFRDLIERVKREREEKNESSWERYRDKIVPT